RPLPRCAPGQPTASRPMGRRGRSLCPDPGPPPAPALRSTAARLPAPPPASALLGLVYEVVWAA
ncbi:hypothetical protein P7K49_028976, partial [Saguinus oedipus]